MSLCHKCEWNNKEASPAKRRACLSCSLSEAPQNNGKVFVRFEGRAEIEAALMETKANALDGCLSRCCQETAFRLLSFFAEMTSDQRELIFAALSGKSLAGIGRERGVTRAAISKKWRALAKKHPELANFFTNNNSTNSTKRGS